MMYQSLFFSLPPWSNTSQYPTIAFCIHTCRQENHEQEAASFKEIHLKLRWVLGWQSFQKVSSVKCLDIKTRFTSAVSNSCHGLMRLVPRRVENCGWAYRNCLDDHSSNETEEGIEAIELHSFHLWGWSHRQQFDVAERNQSRVPLRWGVWGYHWVQWRPSLLSVSLAQGSRVPENVMATNTALACGILSYEFKEWNSQITDCE